MMDLILSVLTGGATGVIGTVLSGVLGYFKERQRHAQELELRKLDLEMMDKESQFALAQEEVRAERAESDAEWAGLRASYAEAATRWSQGMPISPGQAWCLVFVDLVRGLMRPALTLLLFVLVAVVFFQVESSGELRERVVATILYMATAAGLWWFGSRQMEKAAAK